MKEYNSLYSATTETEVFDYDAVQVVIGNGNHKNKRFTHFTTPDKLKKTPNKKHHPVEWIGSDLVIKH
jgi:hypothetical protein